MHFGGPMMIQLLMAQNSKISLLYYDYPSLLSEPTNKNKIRLLSNFRIPPFERKIWHFNRANSVAIKRSMISFPWLQHLSLNSDPDWQVKTFTGSFLNIMATFIPNEIKKFSPRDPPWITKYLKTLLKKKNRLYKNYKRHGYKDDDKDGLMIFVLNVRMLLK